MRSLLHITSYILGFTMICFSTESCNQVYDDLSSCPQNITFRFVSQTPCGTNNDFEGIKNLHIDVYCKSDSSKIDSYTYSPLIWNKAHTLNIPFDYTGEFFLRVWGNSIPPIGTFHNNNYGVYDTNPVIKNKDFQLFYARQEFNIQPLTERIGLSDTVKVNLIPYTYTINLKIVGLPKDKSYHIKWLDNNAEYNLLGEIIKKPITYVSTVNHLQSSTLKTSLTVLKLTKNSNSTLIVASDEGDEMVNLDFKKLMRNLNATGAEINFECEHTLNIELTIDTYEKYFVKVNDWNVVYRNITLY